MKPLHISIESFGPFAKKTEIDFSTIDSFFLISGQTGAGKTSIFDAITFALYGTVAGSRNDNTLKSNYGDADSIPRVDFLFSIHSIEYRVIRQPSYERPAKRGDKTVIENASIIFKKKSKDKWDEITGTTTFVNKSIEDIICLTVEEFTRIVLLPQGEFEKFLIAPSEEKKKLMKRLFPVSVHETLTERAKNKKNHLTNEIRSLKKELETILTHYNPDESLENEKKLKAEELKLTKEYNIKSEEFKDFLTRLGAAETLAKTFHQLKEKEHAYNIHIKQKKTIDSITIKLKESELLNPIIDQLTHHKKIQDRITTYSKDLTDTEAKLKDALNFQKKLESDEDKIPLFEKEISSLTGEITLLKKKLQQEDELKRLTKEQNILSKKIETEEIKFNSIEKNKNNFEKNIETFKKNIEPLEKIISIESELIKKQSTLLNEEKTSLEVTEKEKECAKIIKNKAIAIEEKEKHTKNHEIAITRLNNLKEKKEKSLLSSIAHKLEDNEKCPICGSTEHPQPAKGKPFTEEDLLLEAEESTQHSMKESTRLKSEIDAYELQMTKLIKEIETLKKSTSRDAAEIKKDLTLTLEKINNVEKSKKELFNIKKNLINQEKELKDVINTKESLNKELNELKSDTNARASHIVILEKELKGIDSVSITLKEKSETLKSNEKRLKNINEQINTNKNAINNLIREIEIIKKQKESADKELQQSSEETDKALKSVGLSSIEEARLKYIDKNQQQKIKQQIEEYNNIDNQLTGAMAELKEQTKNKEPEDIDKLQKIKNEFNQTIERLSENLEKIRDQRKEHINKREKYKETLEDLNDLNKKAELIDEVALELSGKNPRNISFQNFILRSYLHLVIKYANQRFQALSEGRYVLDVSDTLIDGRTQSGLDLDVFDAHTGKKRGVTSLSGGEKFLASISLALGMADVIQNRAGAIELDTLFIDEGFGSLDESALDRALTILDELRGNRLVGIISHVKELKSRIPSQIEVQKTPEGSEIIQM